MRFIPKTFLLLAPDTDVTSLTHSDVLWSLTCRLTSYRAWPVTAETRCSDGLFPPIVFFAELIFIGVRIDSEQYQKAIGEPTREIALRLSHGGLRQNRDGFDAQAGVMTRQAGPRERHRKSSMRFVGCYLPGPVDRARSAAMRTFSGCHGFGM
jgi:hypothetical protein